jgi:hypothetical protein
MAARYLHVIVATGWRATKMMPVGKATIVDFLEWIRRSQPHVRSLSGLSKDEFISLAIKYEASKARSNSMRPGGELYARWDSAYMWFGRSSSDREALAEYPG